MNTIERCINSMPPEIIFYGGTGQAIVLRPIVEHYGARVVAVVDDTPGLTPPFEDVPLFLGWQGLRDCLKGRNFHRSGFLIAIGNPHGRVRLRLHDKLKQEGLTPVSIIHPTAFVEKDVVMGEGAQILAGAVVLSRTLIGTQCIVNTKASLDHECRLQDAAELAPGVTLCGVVSVGVNAWVCAGATVLPRISIGDDAIVGAGSVVIEDVPAGATVVGVPAKEMK